MNLVKSFPKLFVLFVALHEKRRNIKVHGKFRNAVRESIHWHRNDPCPHSWSTRKSADKRWRKPIQRWTIPIYHGYWVNYGAPPILDAASRTSHHSVQHSVLVDQSLADAPPIRKKRRETIQQSLSDSSQATAPPFASVDGRVIDRRIFRSYSGSSHPHENKPYAYDPRNYTPTYYPSDTARSHNTKGEQTSYYHNKPAADARSYKVESISTSASSGMSTIQPVEYPTRYHPNQYRPQYPTPQGENRHTMSLPNTGSDLFDSGFHDPEPPFNPRQTRPSSHYNGYFFP